MTSLRLLLSFTVLVAPGCIVWAPVNLGRPAGPAGLAEVVLRRSESLFSPGKVLVVPIDGTLDSESRESPLGITRNTVADVVAQLEAARRDDSIGAVVLRIDSPGGTVTASDLLHRELVRFKQDTGVPVLACLMGVAASGGYYVAVAADGIWALPTSITGSIGVISNYLEVEGLFELLGLQQRTIKSGPLKDVGSPYRDMTDEERALLQDLVQTMHGRFVDVVAAGRPELSRERVEAVADGRPLTAAAALEAGLVDGIAYFDDVLDEAARRAGLHDPDVVTFRLGWGSPGNVYASAPAPGPHAAASERPVIDLSPLLHRETPLLYYLWLPGG